MISTDNAAITYLAGKAHETGKDRPVRVLPAFADPCLELLHDFSAILLNDPEARLYPDVITLAFWCRKPLLLRYKEAYLDGFLYKGRGLIFHIAPANVPCMFAYSLIAGLLSGNANIVRVPSRHFRQVDYICEVLEQLLSEKYKHLESFISCIRYDHRTTDYTRYFSEHCDVRMIWGGNATVTQVRAYPTGPQCFDVVFPNRYSACVIQAEAWLSHPQKQIVVKDFYNDTYLSDQRACSSPNFIFWMGHDIAAAQEDFWKRVHDLVEQQYELKGLQAIAKLEASCRIGAAHPEARLQSHGNRVTRIKVDTIHQDMVHHCPGYGFFVETVIPQLHSISAQLDKRCQTLSVLGIDNADIQAFMKTDTAQGIDRIVPIGQTMNFSLNWDGYDLIRHLSRKISIV